MNNADIVLKTAEHVRQKFEGEGTGHDWWHIYRVWQNAKHIGQKEGGDMFVIELGALLHDIADWKFHKGDESVGPRVASEWLNSLGVDQTVIDQVQNIILHISFKGSGVENKITTLEGKVVQDADRLDAIGAIGIARVFAFGGHLNRPIYNPEGTIKTHSTFEEYKKQSDSSVHHFYEKLLLLKDLMNTTAGKEMALERHQYMENYLKQFLAEWEGKE